MKWTSPGNAGVPDRIVILPRNVIAFVELKAPGESPSPLQYRIMGWLLERGCVAEWVSTKRGVDVLLERLSKPSA